MSHRWRAPGLAALCAIALVASASPGASAPDGSAGAGGPSASEQSRDGDGARDDRNLRDLRDTADFRASAIRTAIAFAGLVVFSWGIFGRRRLSSKASRMRLVLLGAIALAALASYYQFFRLGHPDGFATSDNFHYYVGSKYFHELGYYGLYECSIAALEERGVRVPTGPEPRARDLRTMAIMPAWAIQWSGGFCRERFSPDRWQAFSQDVGWFVEKWPPHIRNAVWIDHGYHPTPVWTLFGSAAAHALPLADRDAVRVLKRLDRVLIAATFVFVAWAFGIEVALLAAIVWGTGHLWRYTWLGDAFLRHLWWIATWLGLAAIRRGSGALGAAGLTSAALLRIFPGAFGFAYGMSLVRRGRDCRPIARDAARFAIGALATTTILVGLSGAAIGHGLGPFTEFAAKIGEFASLATTNKMGLGVLTGLVAPGSPWLSNGLQLGIALGFGWLFWRALADATPWESAAFGFALIPFVMDPTNYYYSTFSMGAVLAARRPFIGVILLATGVVWGINGLVFYRSYVEYPVASGIALAACLAVAFAMTRPVSDPSVVGNTGS
jgi:hypothetical protein